MMTPPTLRRTADRIYQLDDGDIEGLRVYLESHGWAHRSPKAADLYRHTWRSPDGRTTATLFTDGRLIVLGPPVEALDALVVESEVSL